MNSDSQDKVERFLHCGADVSGNVLEASVSFLAASTGGFLAGPAGVFAGAALGPICSNVLKDFASRALSPWEKQKVAGVAAIAVGEIKRRLESQQAAENERFFEDQRKKAEEIFEGVLIKARDTYEKKKLAHLGKLYANIALDSSCSMSEANYLIRLADTLTFTQCCLLYLYSRQHKYLLRKDRFLEDSPSHELTDLMRQTLDLASMGLIGGESDIPDTYEIVSDLAAIAPASMKLLEMGERVYKMLSLGDLLADDVLPVVQILSQPPQQQEASVWQESTIEGK